MLDRLLEVGRRPDGFWRNQAAATPEEAARESPGTRNDNWGYVGCAYAAYARGLPEGDARRARYLDVVRSSMEAVAAAPRPVNWEGGRFDGFADAIEGMVYLLRVHDLAAGADWVDEEFGRLLAYQRPDGFVRRQYLDGNFVRTSLLYGLWKSAGVRLSPWRADVAVGAARGEGGLHLVVLAERPWSGTLVFDGPRHRETLRLADDYPRLNAWPEWFPVDPAASLEVRDPAAGTARPVAGSALRAGLPVEVPAGGRVHLVVR
jgi:hypothetical protein